MLRLNKKMSCAAEDYDGAIKRSFTVIKVVKKGGKSKSKSRSKSRSKALGGRFISSSPASAASKAGTQICRSLKGKRHSYVITIQETTQGSSKKTYVYDFSRVYDPVTVNRGGIDITYKYKTKVKAH